MFDFLYFIGTWPVYMRLVMQAKSVPDISEGYLLSLQRCFSCRLCTFSIRCCEAEISLD